MGKIRQQLERAEEEVHGIIADVSSFTANVLVPFEHTDCSAFKKVSVFS